MPLSNVTHLLRRHYVHALQIINVLHDPLNSVHFMGLWSATIYSSPGATSRFLCELHLPDLALCLCLLITKPSCCQ